MESSSKLPNMKNLFPILFLAVVPNFLLAQQNKPMAFNLQENLKLVANLQVGSPAALGYDNRYEGVRGTPFLFDEYYPADFKKDGKFYQDPKVKYKLNLERNLIHTQFKNGYEIAFHMSAFEEIHLKKGSKIMKFILLNSAYVEGNPEGAKFYEQLNDGPYQLIKQHKKLFKEADYKEVYSNDVRYDEYLDRYQYFIRTPNNTFEKIKLKKKVLLKQFPNWKSDLDKFTKTHNKLRMDTEAAFVAFLQTIRIKINALKFHY